MRQSRRGEVVCRCSAYHFPHRQFGGRCTLLRWVQKYTNPTIRRDCTDCINADGLDCQVTQGLEQAKHCPALGDYIRDNEMKVNLK